MMMMMMIVFTQTDRRTNPISIRIITDPTATSLPRLLLNDSHKRIHKQKGSPPEMKIIASIAYAVLCMSKGISPALDLPETVHRGIHSDNLILDWNLS